MGSSSAQRTNSDRLQTSHICLLVLIYTIAQHSCLSFSNILPHFTELTPDNITTRVKRDISGKVRQKIVSFSALDKHFVLTLTPGSSVLAPGFQVSVVDKKGKTTPFHMDLDTFYTGFFNGGPEHGVDAVEMDEVWIAQIHAPDHWYVVQPRRLLDPYASPTTMLVYENPGLKPFMYMNSTTDEERTSHLYSFCQEVHFQGDFTSENVNTAAELGEIFDSLDDSQSTVVNRTVPIEKPMPQETWSAYHQSGEQLSRRMHQFHGSRLLPDGPEKRSTFNADTCDMLAIADYQTFKGVGERSVSRTIAILVNVYQGADHIFRNSQFGDFKDIGIQLKTILVHTSYTISDTPHYNMRRNIMSGMETLRSLIHFPNFSQFCLMHLTTQRSFGGTLGLASTADDSETAWANGLCASTGTESRNIGLSTPISVDSYPLPISSYTFVVAHEIGHNFGAHHDPVDNPHCSPDTAHGGKFLMWAYAGISWDKNSKYFSPCARKEISSVLKKKAHQCLEPRSVLGDSCGDGILGEAEDCDVGFERKADDKCCQKNCRFQPKAICSPYNYPCCTFHCKIAPTTQVCHGHLVEQCYRPSHCTGAEYKSCPQATPLPNNSTCQNHGRCSHGSCLSFCEWTGLEHDPPRHLQPCTCDSDLVSMCHHCCRDLAIDGPCKVMGGPQDDGIPCLFGICTRGKCVKKPPVIDELDGKRSAKQGSCSGHLRLSVIEILLLIILRTCAL